MERTLQCHIGFFFIILLALLVGGIVIAFSLPKCLLAVTIVFLVFIGERGLRRWAGILSRNDESDNEVVCT